MFAAVAAMLVVSLAAPGAFASDAVTFGVAYFVVRALHLALYAIAGRGDRDLFRAVVRLIPAATLAPVLLMAAGFIDGSGRLAIWGAALAIDYLGVLLGHMRGWRVSPEHFIERFGLIIIIALGESIVALGVGATSLGLSTGVTIGALLGLAVAAALWWAYFDVVATVAERKLREAGPAEQARIAGDSYTILHLPMVAGIVIFAFGVKTTLAHVHAHLQSLPAAALCGGVALYLLALSAFKLRNIGSFNNPRLAAAAALVALAPAATDLPALLSLGLVAAIACGLIAYEVARYAEARERIRHAAVD
jgi:low temperature requirement protein LtrA